MKLVFVVTGFFASIFCSSVYGAFPAKVNLTSLDGKDGFTVKGLGSERHIGTYVSDGGDINGDGKPDFIVSSQPSGVYVFFGREEPWPAKFDVEDLNGSNGFAIVDAFHGTDSVFARGIGDVNGDGIDDFIVGMTIFGQGNHEGRVFVIFGKKEWPARFHYNDIDGKNGFTIFPAIVDDGMGFFVAGIGDFNGDGIHDFALGSFFTDYLAQSCVVFGRKDSWPEKFMLADLDGSNGFIINVVDPLKVSGTSVSRIGDVNGDRIPDLGLGSVFSSDYGRSHVLFGGKGPWPPMFNLSNIDGRNGFNIKDNVFNSMRGNTLSGVGDFDRDGYGDFAVSAPSANSTTSQGYMIYGRAAWPVDINLRDVNGNGGFPIIVNCSEIGCLTSVGSAGDVNADGYPDLLIGSPFGGRNKTGEAYILYGGKGRPSSVKLSNLNGTTGFTLVGINRGDETGWYVSGVGDINEDGLDDFVIGAPAANNEGGVTYVVFGRNGALVED